MVRTRFAPSPTGYLHIGGVRTALFNWLFARRYGGQFILRIDDTDAERNVEASLAPILDGFRWLGLDWDEGAEVGGPHGPYYQSQRQERYREAVAALLAAGAAYHDFATTEEMQAERQAAEAVGKRFVYSRRFRADSAADTRRFESDGRRGVVRLAMPREGTCRFADHVRGTVEVDWSREQDHVVQRADGTCLYNLASVVDDHDMAITHVIRAEEHLPNTPRQIFIAERLGYALPQYAHLPYVAEPGSKNKLSKRKLDQYLKQPDFAQLYERGRAIAAALGLAVTADTFNPVIVDFYRQIGFLPHALLNYLVLLGWSLDDRTEDFSREAMIAAFSLERVNGAPASFDPQKLAAFQARAMHALPSAERATLVWPYLEAAGHVTRDDAATRARVTSIVAAAGDRIQIAGDILDYGYLLADAAPALETRAAERWLWKAPDSLTLLAAFRERLESVEAFDVPTLDALLAAFVTERGLKAGPLVQAVRVAVTGQGVGFSLVDTLAILGRERSLSRIDRVLAQECPR